MKTDRTLAHSLIRILLPAVLSAAVAAVGGAAVVLGEFDDAPGLMLLGLLLVVTAAAIGIRGVRPGRELGQRS